MELERESVECEDGTNILYIHIHKKACSSIFPTYSMYI